MPIFGKEGPPGDTHSHGDLYVEYAVVLPQEVDGQLRRSEWFFVPKGAFSPLIISVG